jgi:hypothetical protein
VDDVVNVWMLVEDVVKSCLIGDVELIKSRPFPADELDAVDDLFGRIVKIVDNDDLVISLKERKGGEGANVARSTAIVNLRCF